MITKMPIVLVGPMASGKSVLSAALSTVLQTKQVCVDRLKWKFFCCAGYLESKAIGLLTSSGLKAYYNYLKNFEFLFLQKIFAEPKGNIYDLGAGFSCFEDDLQQDFCKKTLLSKAFTVLIYSDPCPHKSYRIVQERIQKRILQDPEMAAYLQDRQFNLVKHFVNFYDPSVFKYHEVVYTNQQSITESILSICEGFSLFLKSRHLSSYREP